MPQRPPQLPYNLSHFSVGVCFYVWQILIKVKTSVVDVVMRFASLDISKSREKQQQQKLKITFVDCWC